MCGGLCADLSSDPNHCGALWHGLPERRVHQWGVCRANPDHARRYFDYDPGHARRPYANEHTPNGRCSDRHPEAAP